MNALDRIKVRRLLQTAQKVVGESLKSFIFELNDEETRKRMRVAVVSTLDDLFSQSELRDLSKESREEIVAKILMGAKGEFPGKVEIEVDPVFPVVTLFTSSSKYHSTGKLCVSTTQATTAVAKAIPATACELRPDPYGISATTYLTDQSRMRSRSPLNRKAERRARSCGTGIPLFFASGFVLIIPTARISKLRDRRRNFFSPLLSLRTLGDHCLRAITQPIPVNPISRAKI